MYDIIDILMLVGGALAAVAVAGMCMVSLVVWLAGLDWGHAAEAWRPADES